MFITVLTSNIFFFYGRNAKDEEEEDEESLQNNLLCRFVLDGTGKKIGESISIEEDLLIIKSKNNYLGVPLKHIEDKGKTLLVKGLVDFDKAIEMGEQWRKGSFSEIDQEEG